MLLVIMAIQEQQRMTLSCAGYYEENPLLPPVTSEPREGAAP